MLGIVTSRAVPPLVPAFPWLAIPEAQATSWSLAQVPPPSPRHQAPITPHLHLWLLLFLAAGTTKTDHLSPTLPLSLQTLGESFTKGKDQVLIFSLFLLGQTFGTGPWRPTESSASNPLASSPPTGIVGLETLRARLSGSNSHCPRPLRILLQFTIQSLCSDASSKQPSQQQQAVDSPHYSSLVMCRRHGLGW